MTMTSKQRAKLRGLASGLETIGQFGKGELSDAQVKMVDDQLAKRELIKLRVLETSPYTAAECANLLAERTRSEVVQAIGNRFVLYRRNDKKPVIDLG